MLQKRRLLVLRLAQPQWLLETVQDRINYDDTKRRNESMTTVTNTVAKT